MTANTTCTHHWIIEPPQGALSSGTCQKCGDRKMFENAPSGRKMTQDQRGSDWPYPKNHVMPKQRRAQDLRL
jgi:hypothetical protein